MLPTTLSLRSRFVRYVNHEVAGSKICLITFFRLSTLNVECMQMRIPDNTYVRITICGN
jgi:hypothetical protein